MEGLLSLKGHSRCQTVRIEGATLHAHFALVKRTPHDAEAGN